MWAIVIVIVAIIFALKAGLPALARAIAEAWNNRGENGRTWAEGRKAKKQLVEDAVDSGMAPTATKVGDAVGVATGAVVSGTRVAFAAFVRACQEGWEEGRERAEARRDHLPYIPHTDGPMDSGADADTKSVTCPADVYRGKTLAKCGEPVRACNRYCPKHQAEWEKTSDADGTIVHTHCRRCGALAFVNGLCVDCVCAEAAERRAAAGEETNPTCVDPVIEGDDVRQCGKPTVKGTYLCQEHLAAEEVSQQREQEQNKPRETSEDVCALNGQTVYGTKIACDRAPAPNLYVCDFHEKWLANRRDSSEKGTSMPVESANNSGEIVTYDQFVAELDSALVEARQEKEEAAVQKKICDENLKRAEMMANALTRLKLPDEVVKAIVRSKDSLAAQSKACDERIKAADLQVSQLTIALNAATTSDQKQFYRG